MKRFARLLLELEVAAGADEQVAVMTHYFAEAAPAEAAWALCLLTGGKLKRLVTAQQLREWVATETGLAPWLIEECYRVTGDLAEALALVLPPPASVHTDLPLQQLMEERLKLWPALTAPAQYALLQKTWRELETAERLLLHKLLIGTLHCGVLGAQAARALAQLAKIPPAAMAHRLAGKWQPCRADYLRLLGQEDHADQPARMYPFATPFPFEGAAEALEPMAAWQIEWQWDGRRAQLIKRAGHVLIWTQLEELVTREYPEIAEAARGLPDGTVIDGKIVERPGSNAQEIAVFMASDLLEENGQDIRGQPLKQRRAGLERVFEQLQRSLRNQAEPRQRELDLFARELSAGENPRLENLQLPAALALKRWEDLPALLKKSPLGTAGIQLKQGNAAYGAKGSWWEWQKEPGRVKAVLIQSQLAGGQTEQAELVFGVWHENELVPVAKVRATMKDPELQNLAESIRHHTIEKHGPVRVLKPELVFELAFEGVQHSARRKAGLVLRHPRIIRWLVHEAASNADHLEKLKER